MFAITNEHALVTSRNIALFTSFQSDVNNNNNNNKLNKKEKIRKVTNDYFRKVI